MGAVIAMIAALALVGSVLWLKPSAAQQRQAKLRLLARQLGLDVRLSALPQTRRARVRGEEVQQGAVYRLLRCGEKTQRPLSYLVCRADGGSEWESESATPLPSALRTALDEVLAQLPRDVLAFEITPHGCAVYWRERGDEESVRALRRLLETTQQVLSAV